MEEDILNYSPTVMFRGTYVSIYLQSTGLATKDETSETTLRNSNCLFTNTYDSLQL